MQIETETSAHFRPEVEYLNHPETKVGTRMKRYLAIVLLTALVLALCLPIFARYEVCSSCGKGRLEPYDEDSWDVWCSKCGKYVTYTVVYEQCTICPAGDSDEIYGCAHRVK